MKNLTFKNIALFLIGCLTVGLFVNFVVVKNIFDLQGFAYLALVVLSVIMCGIIIYLLTFLVIKENKQKNSGYDFDMFAESGKTAETLIEKTKTHAEKIKQLNDQISDRFISGELSEIEKCMGKMRAQLGDKTISTKRTAQIEEFFDYYMPMIVKILNSYRRIETNELTGENASETKKQVSAIFPVIKKAFEKELDHMFTDEMIDITTDIQVLESMLAKDGLLDTDKKNMEDKNNDERKK